MKPENVWEGMGCGTMEYCVKLPITHQMQVGPCKTPAEVTSLFWESVEKSIQAEGPDSGGVFIRVWSGFRDDCWYANGIWKAKDGK